MASDLTSGRAMPSPELIDRLSAMRLVPPGARARRGVGERASRTSGPGIEFVDFRTYRAGDDLRHVDPRSIARGAPFTRQYVQRRQYEVTIVLDLTPSMVVEGESKAALAIGLARALGLVTLAGQDRLRLVVLEGTQGERRSPVWQGRTRASEMFGFLAPGPLPRRDREASGKAAQGPSLPAILSGLVSGSDSGALFFVLSDFWEPDIAAPLGALGAGSASVVALHILSAAERDPSLLGKGVMRLVDAETGLERDVTIDENTLTQYRAALGRHIDALADALPGNNLFLEVAAEDTLGDICLERLPAAGVMA